MATYEAVRYAADGCQGEQVPYGDSDGEVIRSGDLEECRSAISRRIGQMDKRRWDGGDDDVEAYHDSDEEGCGGYAIRLASADIGVDDRVEGGEPGTDDYDTGVVVDIDGGTAIVAWDSGVRTPAKLADLRPI